MFGIGAGLRPGELVALRGGDVTRHGRQVTVHVSGPAARVVPVTADYTGRAWELARRAGSGHVFRPGTADRGYKNFVTNFARGLAADPAAPRMSLRRARSAFICGHLAAGTPVGVLLAITGIAEAGSLARYARHVAGISSSCCSAPFFLSTWKRVGVVRHEHAGPGLAAGVRFRARRHGEHGAARGRSQDHGRGRTVVMVSAGRRMRRPGLRAAAGAGRLQHELPLAGVVLAGHRGCRDLEGLPCCCAPMPPPRPRTWRAGCWPARPAVPGG